MLLVYGTPFQTRQNIHALEFSMINYLIVAHKMSDDDHPRHTARKTSHYASFLRQ